MIHYLASASIVTKANTHFFFGAYPFLSLTKCCISIHVRVFLYIQSNYA